MKNILYTGLIILLIATSPSCKKSFLELAPPTQDNAATYYQTAAEFQEALIGVYANLQGWAEPTGWLMGEERSDDARYNPNPNDQAVAVTDRQNVADWLDAPTNSVTPNKWINDYLGIEAANMILDQISGSNIDSADKYSVWGQTEVLRAFFYFDLVQFYGAVPLNLHTVSNPSEAFIGRTSVDSVYMAIIADLKDAITKLPPTVTFPQTGNVSIGTAEMMLANVYMVQGQWALAQPLLQSVTLLGYSLNSTYSAAFSTTNKNSNESIFEVQYLQGASLGEWSAFTYDYIPPVASSQVITGTATNTLNAPCSQNVPTQDFINSYEAGDTARLNATVGLIEGHYDANANFVPDTLKEVGQPIATGETGLYFCSKYNHPSTTPGETNDDWPIYRYSEALLSLAECLNEQGQSAAALPYLNQVRVRAGLAASTVTDQVTLRTTIAHERRIELAFENKRWTDLLRTSQAIPVMTAFAAEVKGTAGVPSDAYPISTTRLLFPIPETEIQVNTLLTQNPGY